MQEQLISKKTVNLAVAKGFDYKEMDKLGYIWKNNTPISTYNTITQSLLQKWLREVHGIQITVDYCTHEEGEPLPKLMFQVEVNVTKDFIFGQDFDEEPEAEFLGEIVYNTYEIALEIGLQEALKLIKEA